MALPRIVVLDGFTLNPGDLSWAPLGALGELEVFERSTRAELLTRARGAELLITNKAVIDAGAIGQLPSLRYIGVTATGTNVVDGAAARSAGIVVSNVPSYGSDTVAEHTLALMLEAVKHLSANLALGRDAWAKQPDFSLSAAPLRLLAGKTLGIVGLGAIGQRVAELALAFKMQVIAASRQGSTPRALPGVTIEPLDVVFERADIVSLHCPLTPETATLVDAGRLARMKPGAILINTARGGLVDEPALAAALSSGQLAGAYLDVLSSEPPPEGHVLTRHPRCHVTPHVAWASVEARRRLLEVTIENVRAFLAGSPANRVV
jgi:glycerate dehydrogenase